jgi:hypothetical protein
VGRYPGPAVPQRALLDPDFEEIVVATDGAHFNEANIHDWERVAEEGPEPDPEQIKPRDDTTIAGLKRTRVRELPVARDGVALS